MSSRTRIIQGTVTVEWAIGEWGEWDRGIHDWALIDGQVVGHEAAYSNDVSPPVAETKLLAYLFRWVVISLSGLFLVAGASNSPLIVRQEALNKIVNHSLAAEDMAWRTGNEARFVQLLDEDVEAEWYRSWRKQWQIGQIHTSSERAIADSHVHFAYLDNELLVTTVEIDRPPDNPWQLTPVIETRFYRHPSLDGASAVNEPTSIERVNSPDVYWLRTAPDKSFWGERRTLETAHLRFEYYERDARIVEQAAPQIEAIYVDFYRILGSSEPAKDPKMMLVLVPSIITKWDAPGYVIEMISPTLMPHSPDLTRVETLVDTAYRRLSYRILAQAIPGTRRYWDTIAVGLRTWLRTQLTDIPSPWHHQTDELYYTALGKHMPLSAIALNDSRNLTMPMNDVFVWQYRVAQSMIEFSVEEYGIESLPKLMQGFARSRRWSNLIDYTYGISAPEWESAWNEYLQRDLDAWKTRQP